MHPPRTPRPSRSRPLIAARHRSGDPSFAGRAAGALRLAPGERGTVLRARGHRAAAAPRGRFGRGCDRRFGGTTDEPHAA